MMWLCSEDKMYYCRENFLRVLFLLIILYSWFCILEWQSQDAGRAQEWQMLFLGDQLYLAPSRVSIWISIYNNLCIFSSVLERKSCRMMFLRLKPLR